MMAAAVDTALPPVLNFLALKRGLFLFYEAERIGSWQGLRE
jgi:hypothetical protein